MREFSNVLAFYLAALGFGLVLIGASAFLDTDHGDVSAHGSGDVQGDSEAGGHGGAAHGGIFSNVLSLRFWTYALGAFGMAGTALTLLGTKPAVHVPVSVALGLLVGGGTAWVFRELRQAAATGSDSIENLLGSEGEVVLPLLPDHLGKIRLRVGEQDVEVPARAGEEDKLEARQRVVVVRFRDGVAEVRPAPWKE